MTEKRHVSEDPEIEATRMLLEDAPCGFLLTQPDGVILNLNRTFLKWSGYERQELIGRKHFADLLSAPSNLYYETHYAPLLRMQGQVHEITLDVRRADGSLLPVLINSVVQAAPDGLVLSTIFDIQERRRYERELLHAKREAEHLATVVEQSSDAIFTTKGLLVLTWNRGAQSLFGYTAAEAIGRNIVDLIAPESLRHVFDTQLQPVMAGSSVQFDSHGRTRSGETCDISVSLNPLIEPPNEVTGFSGIVRDLATTRLMEAAARIARDMALVNRLAHEINNPLQAVTNCLALLTIQIDSNYVRISQENVARAAAVLQDLAEVTKRAAEKTHVRSS